MTFTTTAKPGGGPVLLGRFPGADEPASSTEGDTMTHADTHGDEITDAGLPANFRAFIVPDHTPDTSYLEQDGFEARLAEYEAGNFAFAGVVLEHECECCSVWKTVGSLWNIEHDGKHESTAHLTEVAKELFDEDQAQADA